MSPWTTVTQDGESFCTTRIHVNSTRLKGRLPIPSFVPRINIKGHTFITFTKNDFVISLTALPTKTNNISIV